MPNSLYWVLGYSARLLESHYVKEWFGSLFSSSLSPLCFFFLKNATIRTDIFEIEICRLSIWHFVKSIPGFPDSRYRLPCQMCTEYQTFPHPQPNTPRKACFKKRLKCFCRSLKAWLTSHFWWILPHFTCLVILVPDYILDGSARKKIDLHKLLIN